MLNVTRRELARMAGFFLLGGVSEAASPRRRTAAAAPAAIAPTATGSAASMYASIGVRSFINGRGTVTVIGGSIET